MDVGFISHEKMKELSGELGISLDDAAVTRFDRYAACLVETNKVVNLTRITEPDEIIVKHFIDSLAVCKYCNIENGMKVCDVGTGAGFPGVPLLIAHPDLKMTLMDSTRKSLILSARQWESWICAPSLHRCEPKKPLARIVFANSLTL